MQKKREIGTGVRASEKEDREVGNAFKKLRAKRV